MAETAKLQKWLDTTTEFRRQLKEMEADPDWQRVVMAVPFDCTELDYIIEDLTDELARN